MPRLLLILFLCTFFTRSYATTWDEPWANQVIKNATSFVLAKVIESDEEKGVKIFIIKTLGGKEVKDSIWITGFYLLHMCSSSGHGIEFRMKLVDSCFFFLKQDSTGRFCIATPTTGFAYVVDEKVVATYRHSYHMASVPYNVYENTMKVIFDNYHGVSYDKTFITAFVKEYLNKKPAGYSEEEADIFFLQHVAMESVYHLGLSGYENLLIPFLNDKNNYHNQISAARALRTYNTTNAQQSLLKIVADSTQSGFLQVMCVWSLSEMKPAKLKKDLQQLEKTASEDEAGFGGNIMDPRVCTHMPSVKQALNELLAKL